MLTWQENARPTYQLTESLEESRQYYATVRIQEYQREFPKAAFQTLLHAFRYYGMVYDQGYRLMGAA